MRNAVTNKIRLLKDIQPNPDWLKSQRSNLLLEISQSGKETRRVWSLPGFLVPQFAFKPVIISLVLLCLIFGGGFLTIQAAKNSLPGDLLYSVKLIAENARVRVSSQETKPKLSAELVKARIEELNRIIRETKDLAEKKEKVVKVMDKLQAQVASTEIHLDRIKEEADSEKAVEAAEAVSEKAAQAEEALIEAKVKIVEEFKGEESKEVTEAIDEALAAILAANKERERWIQMEVKEIRELPIEQIPVE